MSAALPAGWPAVRLALLPFAALLAIGAGWGLTTPLIKLAVGAGHGPFGIMLWQFAVGTPVLALLMLALRRGRGPLLPLGPRELQLYLAVGALGMAVPHFFSYTALGHLPAGVVSIIVSMVPLFALTLALALRVERFRPLRALGLGLGATAVVLLIAPEASLPEGAAVLFVPVAMLTPLCYALEGLYVAGRASRAAGPLQTLLGGQVVALALVAPAAWWTGQIVSPLDGLGVAEWAILATAVLSPMAYAGYVALLRATGAVFAAQVAYVVTGSGLVWAILLLGERYSGWVWAALALLFAGLFLVQPRPSLPAVVAPAAEGATRPERDA